MIDGLPKAKHSLIIFSVTGCLETKSYALCASYRTWESFCNALRKVGEAVVIKVVAGFCDYLQTEKNLEPAVLNINVPDQSLIIERAFLVHDTMRILLRFKVLRSARVIVYNNLNNGLAIAVVAPQADLVLATEGLAMQLDAMRILTHDSAIKSKILNTLVTPLNDNWDQRRLALRQISAFAILVAECLAAKYKPDLEAASICSLEEPTREAIESAEAMRCQVVTVIMLRNKSVYDRLKLLRTLWCKSQSGRLNKHLASTPMEAKDLDEQFISEFVDHVMCTVYGAGNRAQSATPGNLVRPAPSYSTSFSKFAKLLTRFPLIAPTRVNAKNVPVEKREAFVRSVFIPLVTQDYVKELLSRDNIGYTNFSFRMDERLRSVSPGWLSSMSCQSPTSLASHTAQPNQQQRPHGTPASAAYVDFDALSEELNTRGGTAHAQDTPASRQAPTKNWQQLLNFNLLDKGQL